jgi:hypothetical protein
MTVGVLAEQVEKTITSLQAYRRGWSEDAGARAEARESAVSALPPIDWLWQASLEVETWIGPAELESAWLSRAGDQ